MLDLETPAWCFVASRVTVPHMLQSHSIEGTHTVSSHFNLSTVAEGLSIICATVLTVI